MFTNWKNVLTGYRIPVIEIPVRHFTEFSQLPVQKKKKKKLLIRHVRQQKGGRLTLNLEIRYCDSYELNLRTV